MEESKASSGRAWSSLRPVLHQTVATQLADWQLSGSNRSDHRHGQRESPPVSSSTLDTPRPLLSIIYLQPTETLTRGSCAYGRHFLVVFSCVWLQCNFNGHFRVSPCRGQVIVCMHVCVCACCSGKQHLSVMRRREKKLGIKSKGGLKLKIILEKCLKARRGSWPSTFCHPPGLREGDSTFAAKTHCANFQNMLWDFLFFSLSWNTYLVFGQGKIIGNLMADRMLENKWGVLHAHKLMCSNSNESTRI